jgi:hypothetical protein
VGDKANASRIVNRMHLAETFRVLGVDVSWTDLCANTTIQDRAVTRASKDVFPRLFVKAKLEETHPEVKYFDKLAFTWNLWNIGLETGTGSDDQLSRDVRLQNFMKRHRNLTQTEKAELVDKFAAKPMGRREWALSALPSCDGQDEDIRAAVQNSLEDQRLAEEQRRRQEQEFDNDLEKALKLSIASQCIQELHALLGVPLQDLNQFLVGFNVEKETLPDVALAVAKRFRPDLLPALDISGLKNGTALASVSWGELKNANSRGNHLQHCAPPDGLRCAATNFVNQKQSSTNFIAKFCLKVSYVPHLEVLRSELENVSVPVRGSKLTSCVLKQLTFLVDFPRDYVVEWLNWWVAVEKRFNEWLAEHAPDAVPDATFANYRNPVWIRPVPVAGTALREVFIDLSNLLHGLEPAFRSKTDRCNEAQRMINFFDAVSTGVPGTLCSGTAQHRFWAGSWKSTSNQWGKWANDCIRHLMKQREWRGTPVRTGPEEAVDDQISAQVTARTRDYVEFDDGKTIVLVSGDGNEDRQETSIIRAATFAVEQGWFLEVWGWENSLSTRYQLLKQKRPLQVSICYLDGYFLLSGPNKDRILHGSPETQKRLTWYFRSRPGEPL